MSPPPALEADPSPRLRLQAPDGASAELYLHGAHVTSWRPAGGEERLFLSARSAFGGSAAIRGGVPLIFPQFATEGPLPRHGFARNRSWQLVEQGAQQARLRLRDDAATRAIWPQAFEAEFELRIGGAQLAMQLQVRNSGDTPWRFTAALHTYLRVDDLGAVTLAGLQGCRYRDSAGGGIERVEREEALRIRGEVDRIYFDAPAELELREPARGLRIRQHGFADTVVWNPGAERGAALADLEADGYRRMLCVEAAAVGRPIALAPGEHWRGGQTLVAL